MTLFNFWLLDPWYVEEDGKPAVYLCGYLDNGEKIYFRDDSYPPHFFVNKKTKNGTLVLLKENSFRQRAFWNVTTDLPREVPEEALYYSAKGYGVYSSDIYFTQVYMKGMGFVPSSWNRVRAEILHEESRDVLTIKPEEVTPFKKESPELTAISIDTEMYNPRGGMPDEEKDPIICFGVYDEDDPEVLHDKSEYDLFRRVYRKIRRKKSDLIFTYNGNEFDWDYILSRCNSNDLAFTIGAFHSEPHRTEFSTISVRGCPTVDCFGYAHYTGAKRKTLPAVHGWMAKEGVLKPRKFKEIDRNRIAWMWDNGQEDEVIDHCFSDITFTHDVGKAILPFAIELSRLSNTPLDQVLSVPIKVIMDNYLYRFAEKYGYVIPNSGQRERVGSTGAIVLPPEKGLFKNVAVFDFKSMYPNVAIKYNISFETFQNGEWLAKPKGMFVLAIENLLAELAEAKKNPKFTKKYSSKYSGEIQGLKVVLRALSPHGYLGYRGSRWYSLEAKEYELRKCRATILRTVSLLRKNGYRVIYGDTDSTFVLTQGFSEKGLQKVMSLIKDKIGLEVDYEFYDKVFFTEAKKKYIALDRAGEIHFTGFENIRGDWCPLAGFVQRRAAEIVLKEENIPKAVKFVKICLKNIERFPIEKFIILKGLSQDPEDYVTEYAHVEVAKRMGTDLGGKVEFVIVKGSSVKLGNRGRHPSEVKSMKEIDYEYYADKQIIPAAERLLGYFVSNFRDQVLCDYYDPERMA